MRRVPALLATSALASMLLAAPTTATAATPDVTQLCTGFADCRAKSYSSSGYEPVFTSRFWDQNGGHNCTNYVAYRLTHGRKTARPPGTGTASTWRDAAKTAGATIISVTDRAKVRKGDVAWWPTGSFGSDSGHVAVVEKVASSGTLVTVSDDNAGGDFGWRVFQHTGRKDTTYPKAFIRFKTSDGSPLGRLTSVTSPVKDQLRVTASGSDPDTYGKSHTVVATIDGRRTARKRTQITFSPTSFFDFQVMTTDRRIPAGRRWVYVYLKNSAKTPGAAYVYLGRKKITLR